MSERLSFPTDLATSTEMLGSPDDNGPVAPRTTRHQSSQIDPAEPRVFGSASTTGAAPSLSEPSERSSAHRRQSAFGNSIRFVTNVFGRDEGDTAPQRRSGSTAGGASTSGDGRRGSSLAEALSAFNFVRKRSLGSIAFRRPISARPNNVRKPYRSTRLGNEIHKPWMKHRDSAHRWARIIFWGLGAMGLAIGIVREWHGCSIAVRTLADAH